MRRVIRSGAMLILVAGLSRCGDSGTPEIAGPWEFSVRHSNDTCNSPHGDFENFSVTITQDGDEFSVTSGRIQLRGVDVMNLAGTLNRNHMEWTATGTALPTAGCSLSVSYSAVGTVMPEEIRGTIDATFTRTPAGCPVEGFCADAEFVYIFRH